MTHSTHQVLVDRHADECCISSAQMRSRLLRRLAPLATVPAAFLAFLLANGGVVIGDHSMHTPVLHLAHPLHFILFTAVALAPTVFSPSRFASSSCHATHCSLHPRGCTCCPSATTGHVLSSGTTSGGVKK
jgi:DIE2/ALG10 family